MYIESGCKRPELGVLKRESVLVSNCLYSETSLYKCTGINNVYTQ